MPLWFQTTQIARPAYYDRNAIGTALAYEAIVGLGASTVRWSYTCPAGKAAYIESLYAYFVRQGLPALSVYNEAWCEYTPVGSPAVKFFDLIFASGNAYDNRVINQTSFGFMKAGDALKGWTAGSDSGGTVTVGIAFKGTQYDF